MQTKPFAFTKNIALNAAALALASGLLAAQSVSAAPVTTAPHTVRALTSSTDDVTLDFVSADINDVLKALAMQTRSNIVSGSDVKGNITVSLAHVSLEEALDLITKLSGYQYAKIGKTYLVGSPTAIQTLTASGSAQAPAVTGVIAFSYSDPADLTLELKQLYPNLKTTPGKSAGGQAGGGVLVVTGSTEDVESARRMISDSESVLSKNIQASRTEVYKIKYVSADDLQLVLARLVPGVIITPGPVQRTYAPAPTTADVGGSTATTTSIGSGVAAGGAITSVTGNLPTKPTTTSLLLTGSESDLARAIQVLATVDQRPAQINFETKITEINLTKADHLGLTYDFSGASTNIGELLGIGETRSSTTFVDPYPGKILKGRTFGRTPIASFVNVQLNALFQSGDAKLLSSPNISAVDGQPAAVFIGDSITYVSSVTTGPTGQNITTATVNAGIKLLVTGKVNNDGYVTMNIHPEVSTPTFKPSIGGAVLPDISTREATTTLRVKDGDTIAIGGLISEQDVKNITKVPFLGDLPFFGQLFRDSQTSHNRNEIVIFVKVSVQKEAV